MPKIIGFILAAVFISIVVLLCFFSCMLASISDDYWDELKNKLEGEDDDDK